MNRVPCPLTDKLAAADPSFRYRDAVPSMPLLRFPRHRRPACASELNVSSNAVGAIAAAAMLLAAADGRLTALRLRGCGVTADVLPSLAFAVACSHSLTELDLQSNLLNDECASVRAVHTRHAAHTRGWGPRAQAVKDALATNVCLQRLCLEDNRTFEEHGIVQPNPDDIREINRLVRAAGAEPTPLDDELAA
jgi:hypothetical protein